MLDQHLIWNKSNLYQKEFKRKINIVNERLAEWRALLLQKPHISHKKQCLTPPLYRQSHYMDYSLLIFTNLDFSLPWFFKNFITCTYISSLFCCNIDSHKSIFLKNSLKISLHSTKNCYHLITFDKNYK